MRRTNSRRTIIRWFVGGGMIAAGLGWVGLMLRDFILLQLHLVPSWDIGLTFWYPIACITFPFAAVAIIVGCLVVRGWRDKQHAKPGASADGGA